MSVEDFGGGKRAERVEIEARVREIVSRNQEILKKVPEGVEAAEYWETLRREGRPATLTVRRPDGSGVLEQRDMYFIDTDVETVEMTYFSDDGVEESFFVAFDRIESLE